MTKLWLSIGPLATLGAALAVACTTFSSSDGPQDAGAFADAGLDGDLPVGDASAPGAPEAPSGVAPVAVPVVTVVTTLAGDGNAAFRDGQGAYAEFNGPSGVAVDAAGNVYVADTSNQRVRKVTATGLVTTLAGSGTAAFANGTGAAASFSGLLGVASDAAGTLHVADSDNGCIRAVSSTGAVSTLAGLATSGGFVDGTGAAARFNVPGGIAVAKSGDLYVADRGNSSIRKVTPTGVVTTLAGATLVDPNPTGIAVDGAGNVYVADPSTHRVRKVTPAGVVTTLAGSGVAASGDGPGAVASFMAPSGVAVDAAGNVYVADGRRMRRVTPAGMVTTLAGSDQGGFADGPGPAARFDGAFGVAVDTGGTLTIADAVNHRIRKLTSIGIGQLAVVWNAPSSTGAGPVTAYEATASAKGGITRTCSTTGATSCTISKLTSGVTYSVSVTATNAAGDSPPSSSVSATPN